MRRTRRSSYGMAMVAGIAIVGASTGAVVGATHHHDQAVAAIAATAESVGVATSSSRIEQPSSVTPPASTLLNSTPSASAPLDSTPSDSAPRDTAQSEADSEATAPVGSAPGAPVPSAPSHSTPVTASGAAPGTRSGQKVAPITAPTPAASTRKTTAATSSPTPGTCCRTEIQGRAVPGDRQLQQSRRRREVGRDRHPASGQGDEVEFGPARRGRLEPHISVGLRVRIFQPDPGEENRHDFAGRGFRIVIDQSRLQ